MFSKLMNGDSLELLKDIPDESIDLIVTDPPYKIITGGDSDGKNSVRPKGMLAGDRKLFDVPPAEKWIPQIFRILKNGAHCYIFTNVLNMQRMLNCCMESGFLLHNILVWEKNNCTPSQFYMKNCEYVLFLRKGKAKWINNIGESKTVHSFKNIIGRKTHPTEKPVELLQFYIENSSQQGDIVCDPFMGTGATGVACSNANRRFVGMEIDVEYYKIATERMRMNDSARID